MTCLTDPIRVGAVFLTLWIKGTGTFIHRSAYLLEAKQRDAIFRLTLGPLFDTNPTVTTMNWRQTSNVISFLKICVMWRRA